MSVWSGLGGLNLLGGLSAIELCEDGVGTRLFGGYVDISFA